MTGDEVTLWLIVGHSKDICRHTPDICYPSSGFKKRADENSKQPFIFEGQPEADFYTNTLTKEDASGRQIIRVFWSWYKPNSDHTINWEAPTNVRWTFGNARSLYKMYFTSVMKDIRERLTRALHEVCRTIPARRGQGAGDDPAAKRRCTRHADADASKTWTIAFGANFFATWLSRRARGILTAAEAGDHCPPVADPSFLRGDRMGRCRSRTRRCCRHHAARHGDRQARRYFTRCVGIMTANHITGLPVMDGKSRCIGLITASDILGFEEEHAEESADDGMLQHSIRKC